MQSIHFGVTPIVGNTHMYAVSGVRNGPSYFFRQKFTKVLGWKKLFLGKHKFMLSRLWIAENWIWRLIYPAWNKDSHWKSMVGRWIFLLGRPIFRGPCWFWFFSGVFHQFFIILNWNPKPQPLPEFRASIPSMLVEHIGRPPRNWKFLRTWLGWHQSETTNPDTLEKMWEIFENRGFGFFVG